jgi:hypothetical protein
MPKKLTLGKKYLSFTLKYIVFVLAVALVVFGIFWQKVSNTNRYQGDNFSIQVPGGWVTKESQNPQILVTLITQEEEQTQNVNSYIAVNFEKVKGKNLNQETEDIKTSIKEGLPQAKIENEEDMFVGGNLAKFMEVKLSGDQNFASLFMVVSKGDSFYIITSYTSADKWGQYKDLFYKTAESFKLG